jgi:opacity protein-like surface antigen
MTRASVALSAIALIGVLAGSSAAAESGFYAGVAGAIAQHDVGKNNGVSFHATSSIMTLNARPLFVDTEDRVPGWNLTLGYRLNDYVAAELEYLDLGSADVTENYGPSSLPPPYFQGPIKRHLTASVAGPAVSIVGSWPLGERFEVFGGVGYLFADQEIEERTPPVPDRSRSSNYEAEVWLGSIGVSWEVAPRWALRLEYMRTSELDATRVSGENEIQALNLGALFRL